MAPAKKASARSPKLRRHAPEGPPPLPALWSKSQEDAPLAQPLARSSSRGFNTAQKISMLHAPSPQLILADGAALAVVGTGETGGGYATDVAPFVAHPSSFEPFPEKGMHDLGAYVEAPAALGAGLAGPLRPASLGRWFTGILKKVVPMGAKAPADHELASAPAEGGLGQGDMPGSATMQGEGPGGAGDEPQLGNNEPDTGVSEGDKDVVTPESGPVREGTRDESGRDVGEGETGPSQGADEANGTGSEAAALEQKQGTDDAVEPGKKTNPAPDEEAGQEEDPEAEDPSDDPITMEDAEGPAQEAVYSTGASSLPQSSMEPGTLDDAAAVGLESGAPLGLPEGRPAAATEQPVKELAPGDNVSDSDSDRRLSDQPIISVKAAKKAPKDKAGKAPRAKKSKSKAAQRAEEERLLAASGLILPTAPPRVVQAEHLTLVAPNTVAPMATSYGGVNPEGEAGMEGGLASLYNAARDIVADLQRARSRRATEGATGAEVAAAVREKVREYFQSNLVRYQRSLDDLDDYDFIVTPTAGEGRTRDWEVEFEAAPDVAGLLGMLAEFDREYAAANAAVVEATSKVMEAAAKPPAKRGRPKKTPTEAGPAKRARGEAQLDPMWQEGGAQGMLSAGGVGGMSEAGFSSFLEAMGSQQSAGDSMGGAGLDSGQGGDSHPAGTLGVPGGQAVAQHVAGVYDFGAKAPLPVTVVQVGKRGGKKSPKNVKPDPLEGLMSFPVPQAAARAPAQMLSVYATKQRKNAAVTLTSERQAADQYPQQIGDRLVVSEEGAILEQVLQTTLHSQ